MALRFAATIAAAATLALTGCGGDDEPSSSAPAEDEREEVTVIREWSEALSEGDVEAAAEYFAIPSVAVNGVRLDITEDADAVLFNRSLPCGAELESTEIDGDTITATFRLTLRPGVAACPGEGQTAQTAFVIEDGLITEWRRADAPEIDPEAPPADPDLRQSS